MSNVDVKSIIVESAAKYFSKYGFHKTTMGEIAKNIHKAKGVIYYYFKSKEDLFNEVLKHELNNIKLALSKIVNEDTDALNRIERYVLTRYKLLNEAHCYHETLKADFFEKYVFVKDVRDDFEKFEIEQLNIILKKGIAEGYLLAENDDIKAYLNLIILILRSLEIPLFLQNNYNKNKSSIENLCSLIFSGLKAQKNKQ